MFKELYPSDFIQLSFERAVQILPFKANVKEAIEATGKDVILLKDNDYFCIWSNKDKEKYLLHVSIEDNQLQVKQFIDLKPNNLELKGSEILLQLAKKFRMTQIVLVTNKKFDVVDKKLRAEKYRYISDLGYVRRVDYHTGLVLGGGGAKGAYQIGVWRALEELSIEYQLISGTSVGALNGALLLQGDIEVAEEMWRTITTNKILDVPGMEEGYSINQLIQNWQNLTLRAIQSGGVDTKPLLDLINRLMIPDIIFEKKTDFYLVVTTTPKMEEKIVSLKEMTVDNLPLWLLASSSFYPAMAPCFIDGNYYIDGGYRNNVPKDVLVEQGATELIVVDVSGPGLSKSYKLPQTIVETKLKSPWKLGSMLLFDGNRATWNMELGYLETMKVFGHLKGVEYTFFKTAFKEDCVSLSKEFFVFLQKEQIFTEWYNKKTSLKIWEWLIKNSQRPETISLSLLESLGKELGIAPTESYTLESFSELVINKWHNKEVGAFSDNMLKSVSEWFSLYLQQKSPLSTKQLLNYYYAYFKTEGNKHKEVFWGMMEISWMTGLEALFLIFLEERNK